MEIVSGIMLGVSEKGTDMRIGIMSMQRVINYGSYMQALALKTILQELGHEVVFVDYEAKPSIQHRRSFRYWISRARSLLRNTGLVWTVANLFRRRPIGYRTTKEYTDDERAFIPALEKLGVDYAHPHYRTKVDALIIGSDEVFNCLQNADNVGFSPELFGKNNRAKILLSYAASFGNTTLERLQKYGVGRRVGRYLKKFDALSVRDENSARIVRELTGREPEQHMDPALIGGIENMTWKSNTERGYVAVYAYPNRISREEGEDIQRFAEKRGLQVLSLCGKQDVEGFENRSGLSPKEILPYIKNAAFVVTDTFHGTIFSIIQHVPFAVYCRRPQDEPYSNSEKLLDLLCKFELTDRLVSADNDLETIARKEIDFTKSDRIRRKERERTIDYLRLVLENKVKS